jgi:hypothetical protein
MGRTHHAGDREEVDATIRRSKICHMSYKMGWVGRAAFQALDGDRELVFDLADGISVPPEFKEGDDIDIVVNPAHPAMIAMDMNTGFYEIVHLKSGVKFDVPHKTSEWRFK